jgi:multidrug efflux pump subunit AcrB
MFSAIFVDRPRLAIVIALVTTIAGLVSLLVNIRTSCHRRSR